MGFVGSRVSNIPRYRGLGCAAYKLFQLYTGNVSSTSHIQIFGCIVKGFQGFEGGSLFREPLGTMLVDVVTVLDSRYGVHVGRILSWLER